MRIGKRDMNSRGMNKRLISSSSDYTKVMPKGKLDKLNRIVSKDSHDPMSLSLSTKYAKLNRERVSSLSKLTQSWSKAGGLSIKSDIDSENNPVLIQDNKTMMNKYKQSGFFARSQNPSILKYTHSNIMSELGESPLRIKSPKATFKLSGSIDADLSAFTIQENTVINSRIEKLKHIEKNNKRYIRERTVMKQDCSEMLKTTMKEIKNISYKL